MEKTTFETVADLLYYLEKLPADTLTVNRFGETLECRTHFGTEAELVFEPGN